MTTKTTPTSEETFFEELFQAIDEGRAFLDTDHLGRRKVTAYNVFQGWVTTNNSGDPSDRKSFFITQSDIVIVPVSS